MTSLAKLLGEFEVNPFVHNDEEYGKYMVEESGLFDVDELLLPHINYASFAADKRQGTLVTSGYVEDGFVGATRELQKNFLPCIRHLKPCTGKDMWMRSMGW